MKLGNIFQWAVAGVAGSEGFQTGYEFWAGKLPGDIPTLETAFGVAAGALMAATYVAVTKAGLENTFFLDKTVTNLFKGFNR